MDVAAEGASAEVEQPGQLRYAETLTREVDDLQTAISFRVGGAVHLGIQDGFLRGIYFRVNHALALRFRRASRALELWKSFQTFRIIT